jgi:predicted acylesterase/phospholipase RssA
MGQNIRNEELKTYADIVIHPNIDHISGTDFTVRSTLIIEGEKAALASIQTIKQSINSTKDKLNLR